MNIEDSKLKVLAIMGNKMKTIGKEITKLQAELQEKQKQYDIISSIELPEYMAELGLLKFSLTDGTLFEVQPVFVVTLPKDRIDTADEWLEDNGHGGMVKTHVDVEMPRGSPDKLLEIQKALEELKFNYEVKKGIHYQTLNAWAREMEREGIVIPEDIFNVFRSNKTVIKE